MKSILLVTLLFCFGTFSQAEITILADVDVVFSPDPEGAQALVSIANALSTAEESIDIAIYNMGVKGNNPVIALLSSSEMQTKIQSGELKIRLLFEGFSSDEGNSKRMAELEELGLDVRHIGSASSRDMHHKFALVDAKTNSPTLITGSGNWSLTSATKYDENTLFFRNAPGLSSSFLNEFQFLWSISDSFGNDLYANYPVTESLYMEEYGLEAHFNTDNYRLTDSGRLFVNRDVEGWTITRQIVKAIDEAQENIQIATTRFKLRPIYDAVLRAAARGVDVKIVVTMDEYVFFDYRESYVLYQNRRSFDEVIVDETENTAETEIEAPTQNTELFNSCNENPYQERCSSGVNFAVLLDRSDYEGHENVSVRLKWFHMNPNANLTQQMHSKYVIIDSKTVLTGSFNWSNSAEYNHIENIIKISGTAYHQTLRSYTYNFETLWNLRRENFLFYVDVLETEVAQNSETRSCKLEAMALSFSRIDYLLDTGVRMGAPLGCSSEGSTGVE